MTLESAKMRSSTPKTVLGTSESAMNSQTWISEGIWRFRRMSSIPVSFTSSEASREPYARLNLCIAWIRTVGLIVFPIALCTLKSIVKLTVFGRLRPSACISLSLRIEQPFNLTYSFSFGVSYILERFTFSVFLSSSCCGVSRSMASNCADEESSKLRS